jgi:hypothetical protein
MKKVKKKIRWMCSRVRFPVLPDYLRSSGSGTGSTQPRVSITEELLEWKSSGSGSRKSRLTAVGIRCADHATPSIRKKKMTLPTTRGHSVVIIRLRTGVMYSLIIFWIFLSISSFVFIRFLYLLASNHIFSSYVNCSSRLFCAYVTL